MHKFITYFLVVVCFCACGNKSKSDRRPVVAVSIEPYRYFVNQVAGDKFRVVSVVPVSSNPENYEPTPQQMVDICNCRAYMLTGNLAFEKTSLQKIARNAPNLLAFDLSHNIIMQKESGGEGVDPHVWMSPQNVKVIAENICSNLCEIDSANSKYYLARLKTFQRHIDDVDKEIRRYTNASYHRSFLIYHPALAYFAKEYGLQQISVSYGDKEPSPVRMGALIVQSKREHVSQFFVQQQFGGSGVAQIAKESGTRIVKINPLSYNWDKEIVNIAKNFSR